MGRRALDVELESKYYKLANLSFALSGVSSRASYVREVWASKFAGIYWYSSCDCEVSAYKTLT